MISKSTLQKAVNQNIIQPQQLEPLYQFLQDDNSVVESSVTDEPLKFVRSFGDVFIMLGIVLLAIAINKISLNGYYAVLPVIGFVVVAEWLVRVRRLVLPGIAILLCVLFFVNKGIPLEQGTISFSSLAIISVTSLLFYWRYKMPFSLLPFAASLVAIAVMQMGLDMLNMPILFAAFGLLIFVAALWFDAQDTKRISHMSDSAFWLHLLAAPLMVHGVMASMLLSEQQWIGVIGSELIILLFFVTFFLLALLIDRRAMLVSTQLYVIYALTQLFQDRVNSTQDIMIYILMALGLFVIYFGAYWYKTRRFIFGFMAESSVAHYIPDLNSLDVKRK